MGSRWDIFPEVESFLSKIHAMVDFIRQNPFFDDIWSNKFSKSA